MKNNDITLSSDHIGARIFMLRGVQVILDRDLARFYGVETRALNQAVKRNAERFPGDFMLQLDSDLADLLVSQGVIPSRKHFGGHLPQAFTEEGVAMLSGVLRSETAVTTGLAIMRAFVAMRRLVASNMQFFNRMDRIERKQLEHEDKIERIFKALEKDDAIPSKGIFYDGQVFDAYRFVADIIKGARVSIRLIDNFVDESVLTLLSKRNRDVSITVYSKNISEQLILDVDKFNKQYGQLEVKKFNLSHDRFLIVDDEDIYHIGASLKDLGKKWFAFSKLDKKALSMLERLS